MTVQRSSYNQAETGMLQHEQVHSITQAVGLSLFLIGVTLASQDHCGCNEVPVLLFLTSPA